MEEIVPFTVAQDAPAGRSAASYTITRDTTGSPSVMNGQRRKPLSASSGKSCD
jgi:hypothetical protein